MTSPERKSGSSYGSSYEGRRRLWGVNPKTGKKELWVGDESSGFFKSDISEKKLSTCDEK